MPSDELLVSYSGRDLNNLDAQISDLNIKAYQTISIRLGKLLGGADQQIKKINTFMQIEPKHERIERQDSKLMLFSGIAKSPSIDPYIAEDTYQ